MELDHQIRGEKRTDLLKLIAILTMLIDHTGHLIFPQYIIFRIIGRVAFPIFAYHLVIGYRNTSNLKKYVYRLGIFAVISQIPFTFFGRGLNIFITLLIGILALHLYDKNKNFLLYILFAAILLTTYFGFYFDYGLYGVILILIFHVYLDEPKSLAISFTVLTLLYCIEANYYIQMFSLLAIPLFYLNYKPAIRLNRYFFYAFYPVHITILLIINYFIR